TVHGIHSTGERAQLSGEYCKGRVGDGDAKILGYGQTKLPDASAVGGGAQQLFSAGVENGERGDSDIGKESGLTGRGHGAKFGPIGSGRGAGEDSNVSADVHLRLSGINDKGFYWIVGQVG